jgi:hypothetical protein
VKVASIHSRLTAFEISAGYSSRARRNGGQSGYAEPSAVTVCARNAIAHTTVAEMNNLAVTFLPLM